MQMSTSYQGIPQSNIWLSLPCVYNKVSALSSRYFVIKIAFLQLNFSLILLLSQGAHFQLLGLCLFWPLCLVMPTFWVSSPHLMFYQPLLGCLLNSFPLTQLEMPVLPLNFHSSVPHSTFSFVSWWTHYLYVCLLSLSSSKSLRISF